MMKEITQKQTSAQVTHHIQNLSPELGLIVETIRQFVLSIHPLIGERIKWNNPSFYYTGEMQAFNPKEYKREIAVFNLFKGEIKMVFTTGAKITNTYKLFTGDYEDGRRIVTFKDLDDFNLKQQALREGILDWISKVE